MDYKQEMEKVNKLIEQRKTINNEIRQKKDEVENAIYIALHKRLPASIDIDNEIVIRVNEASVDVCVYKESCNIPTKVISILEDIFGEGKLYYDDNELNINFEY